MKNEVENTYYIHTHTYHTHTHTRGVLCKRKIIGGLNDFFFKISIKIQLERKDGELGEISIISSLSKI